MDRKIWILIEVMPGYNSCMQAQERNIDLWKSSGTWSFGLWWNLELVIKNWVAVAFPAVQYISIRYTLWFLLWGVISNYCPLPYTRNFYCKHFLTILYRVEADSFPRKTDTNHFCAYICMVLWPQASAMKLFAFSGLRTEFNYDIKNRK